jgi:hypothetical protein
MASRAPIPAAMHAITNHPDRRSARVEPMTTDTIAAHSMTPASHGSAPTEMLRAPAAVATSTSWT